MPGSSQQLIDDSDHISLDDRSILLRHLVVDAIVGGGRGHIGSSMSLIEILRVLYDDIIHVDPKNPNMRNRDRFILSKGHGCLAQYAVLAEKGFFDVADLKTFCDEKSYLGGHPEFGKVPGVEASTGALGHGLAMGAGMALAAKIKNESHHVYVVTGDGEINEGSVWEAAMSCAKHRLDNLTVMIDYNKIQSYGPTSEVLDLEPLPEKWQSFGFHTVEVNGHDVNMLRSTLKSLRNISEKPKAIICHTVKGKGISFAEHDPKWHHKSKLGSIEISRMRAVLGGGYA